jgi:autotransporter-associated beta strand protein/probable HAF family extracellular repeat protein
VKNLFSLLIVILLISSHAATAWSASAPYSYEVIDLSAVLGTDGASTAVDINNNGQVIGQSPGGAFIYNIATRTVTYPNLGDTSAIANAINNNGQVVGAASGHAFLYSNGAMTSLGSSTISANGINDSGQIVGYGNFIVDPDNDTANRAFSAFVTQGNVSLNVLGNLLNQDPLGTSYAYSINNSGQIVGEASSPTHNDNVKKAFLYSSGSMTNLGTFGGTISKADSINNNGQIVGLAAISASTNHGFLYDSAMNDLGRSQLIFNNCYASEAKDINNNGQVVGNALGLSGGSTTFLYDGSMTDLNAANNTPSYQINSANAINDLGQIAVTGKYTGSSFYTRALVLTPATRTWDGGGTTNNWITTPNWDPDNMPVKGSAIIFTGTNRQTNVNNSTLTNLGLVTFNNGGFNISGNALALNAGIVSTGDNTWAINSTLPYSQSFISLSGKLTISGNVNNSGNLLTVDGPGNHLISGAISGTGGLTKSGSGTLTLSSTNNAYSGVTTINNGVLEITGGVNLGTTPLIDVNGGMAVLKTTNVNNNVLNIETASIGTFLISDGAHTIGNIDGSGTTEVNGQLTVNSIEQGILTIDSGGTLTIAALPGGPTSEPAGITAVPEPATLILAISAVSCALIYRRVRILSVHR